MFPGLIQSGEGIITPQEGSSIRRADYPCLVLTSDPKPRLRWTTDLHDRFVDAVTQLGGPGKATPKAIMRIMGVKGLTLFHLKSHLQKYRLGKQAVKDVSEALRDGVSASYLLESPATSNCCPSLPTSDMNEGYEVKEALRAQMEVQSKLHLQVEAEKHLQIRQDAEQRYMVMLERTCRMLADQFIGGTVINNTPEKQKLEGLAEVVGGVNEEHEEKAPPFTTSVHPPTAADCSTESCLTNSHESPGAGGKRRILSVEDTMRATLIWGQPNMSTKLNKPHGITECGI